MNVRCCFNQILQTCRDEEVSQMRKLAVSLVFHVDETPAVLAATDLLAVNNNGLLRANNSKGDDALDLLVQLSVFLVVVLIRIVGVQVQVVVGKLLLQHLLEGLALGNGHGIGLGNNRHDVGGFGELLQHSDINRAETVAGGLNEEKNTVDTRVREVAVTLSRELLAQVL